jgi:hypothetical protein
MKNSDCYFAGTLFPEFCDSAFGPLELQLGDNAVIASTRKRSRHVFMLIVVHYGCHSLAKFQLLQFK